MAYLITPDEYNTKNGTIIGLVEPTYIHTNWALGLDDGNANVFTDLRAVEGVASVTKTNQYRIEISIGLLFSYSIVRALVEAVLASYDPDLLP